MKDREKELIQKYEDYRDNGSIYKWNPESSKLNGYMDRIYNHISTDLAQYLKSHKQNLVGYWPVYLVWGQSNDISMVLSPGLVIRSLDGLFGTGYIAVSDQSIFLFSFQDLTKSFPMMREAGFFLNFLTGMGGQEDHRKASKKDSSWVIPSSKIKQAAIHEDTSERRSIVLDTSLGQWQIESLFSGFLEDINTAIVMSMNECLQLKDQGYTERRC